MKDSSLDEGSKYKSLKIFSRILTASYQSQITFRYLKTAKTFNLQSFIKEEEKYLNVKVQKQQT